MVGGMSIWRQSLPGLERNLNIIILLSFRLDHSKQIQMRFLLENCFSLLFHQTDIFTNKYFEEMMLVPFCSSINQTF